MNTPDPIRYIVVGVLLKRGTNDVFERPMTAVTATDFDAALDAFADEAGREYPDYDLIGAFGGPLNGPSDAELVRSKPPSGR
jgi:hypothetical protein